jgi:protein SCO1/2
MKNANLYWIFLVFLLIGACQSSTSSNQPLPILGEPKIVDGKEVFPTIPDFQFTDQDSNKVNNATFAGKAYVADFFFISCPTICPRVTKQMLRVYQKFKNDDRIVLLSHTVDTKHDTIPRLKEHAKRLEAATDHWHFVTGNRDSIYNIANNYFSPKPSEDASIPGGYNHSGLLILVDPKRHVRAFADGTDPKAVDQFMIDIERLLKEMGGGK